MKAKVEAYINANLLLNGATAEITNISSYNSELKFLTVAIKSNGQVVGSVPVYATLDGSVIISGDAFKTNETVVKDTTPTTPADTTPAVVKADKPKAEAFVMSFCPYGLQFLKAYVPVMELLGNKADLSVNFVSYMMHGGKELDGNNYIYCVQKEYKANLTAYLRCSVENGDYTGCVKKTGLDEAKVGTCIVDLDAKYNLSKLFNNQSTWAGGQYPLYPVEADLNDKYGVQGSPTFVLNGQQVSVSRTANAIKSAICASFNTPPAECETNLSTAAETAGVGAIGSAGGSTTTASCG
jgi:hypothetical protein